MTVLPEAPSDSALAACGHPWQQLSSFYQPWAHTCVLDFAPKWIMEKRCLCFQEEWSYPNWSPNPAVFQLQVWGVWKLLTLEVTSHRSWTEACQLTILMERAFCKVSLPARGKNNGFCQYSLYLLVRSLKAEDQHTQEHSTPKSTSHQLPPTLGASTPWSVPGASRGAWEIPEPEKEPCTWGRVWCRVR